jgi:hypothetical protein
MPDERRLSPLILPGCLDKRSEHLEVVHTAGWAAAIDRG